MMLEIDLKTSAVEMTYNFDKAEQCIVVKKELICREVSSFSLRGFGGYYNGITLVEFQNDNFTMDKVKLIPSKGKGNTGYGLDYEFITDLTLTFTVSVEPNTE